MRMVGSKVTNVKYGMGGSLFVTVDREGRLSVTCGRWVLNGLELQSALSLLQGLVINQALDFPGQLMGNLLILVRDAQDFAAAAPAGPGHGQMKWTHPVCIKVRIPPPHLFITVSSNLIGLKNAIAELPVKNDGSWPRITMTTVRDVGRFVVASLDLPKWEEDMSMAGDTLAMGELLAHAEAVTGKKSQVSVVKQGDLDKKMRELAPDDFMARLWT
ncbi:hypothetical protein EJ07DRAFT_152264 [Lizonia empirigonia]|nr:hypothetical protein EJ07DRAFT_152264 [Lizonia empirigonia]